jgi:Sec-independent protein translocase protein TatA
MHLTVLRFFGFAAVLLALLTTGCGKDPRTVKITEKNKDTFLKEIKDMKGLTVEEVGLLMSVQLQNGMRKAFGGSELRMVDKTVGELLTELKKEAAERDKENDRQEKLAAEARAKEEARIAELRKAVTLTVADKGFYKADYEEFITIKVAYENTSGKDIRAFTGKIQFTDLFGKEIFESGVTISNPVKAGARGNWDGSIKYNQFIDHHKALRFADLNDMKIVWKPSSILFADGSKIGESAE